VAALHTCQSPMRTSKLLSSTEPERAIPQAPKNLESASSSSKGVYRRHGLPLSADSNPCGRATRRTRLLRLAGRAVKRAAPAGDERRRRHARRGRA
jgi:hypothetical protein